MKNLMAIERDGVWVIEASDALKLKHVEGFAALLSEALDTHEKTIVDFSHIERVHSSVLQVLCAAHKKAAKLGRSLALRFNPDTDLLERSGFLRQRPCQRLNNPDCLFIRKKA